MDVDNLLKAVGSGRGWYQRLVYFSLCLIYMRGSWHAFAVMFLGGNPGYHCKTDPEVGNKSFPDGECHLWVESNGVNVSEECIYGMEYGNKDFHSTILTEYDLVCSRDYMVDLSSTIYMVGNAFGAVLISPLSDRFGRKWVLLISLWLQGLLGAAVIFSGGYIVFTILRFFVGFLNMAIALITYVMIAEIFPSEIRTRRSIAASFFWSLGVISLSLFGYLVRDWKHLELLISLPNLLTIIYIWTLPESIPWMVTNRRNKQLKTTLKSAAKINGISLPEDLLVQVDEYCSIRNDGIVRHRHAVPDVTTSVSGQSNTTLMSGTGEEGICHTKDEITVLDLFKTPKMRRYTLIMFYLWFVNSLGYFGTMFATPMLHGNIFVNLALSGAVEIPAIATCIVFLERVGRRKPLVCFMFLCGVMNIAAVFVPQKTDSGIDLRPLHITLAMIGKFGISGAYSTVYLMSAEIFPTIVRNQAIGLSSFCENTGSIAAPFIVFGAKNLAQMPLVLFGVLTIIGGVLALLLVETHNKALPETIEDVEGRKTGPDRPHTVEKESVPSGTRL